ncbi:hypothetical protein AAG570_007799 [Ranatra chinensis]|uniref:CCHC-type domain-containing protein n=1 Tax=Ranatra chinensis TaxID=642074 RepID=A0ABD0XUJ5_9HEMI
MVKECLKDFRGVTIRGRKMKCKKSLVVERIKREMPKRLKKVLKSTSTPLRLDKAVDLIREEDEDFQESRRVEESWTRVSNNRPRREIPRREYRERVEYRPQASKPKWTPREDRGQKKEYRAQEYRGQKDRKDKRRCYQCKEIGHIARFCPYIRRSGGYRDRGEPWKLIWEN